MSTPSDNSAATLSGNSGEDFNPPAGSPATTAEPSPLLLPEPAAKPPMPTDAQVKAAKYVLDSLNKVFSPAGSEPAPIEDDADAEPKPKRSKRARAPVLPPAPWVDLTGPTIEERLDVLEAKSVVAEAERKELKRDLSEIRTAQVTAMRELVSLGEKTAQLWKVMNQTEKIVMGNQVFCSERLSEHNINIGELRVGLAGVLPTTARLTILGGEFMAMKESMENIQADIKRVNEKVKVEIARIDQGCDELAERIAQME